MNLAETNLLADLIRRKHDCLSQLGDLGRQQLALIEEGDIRKLLEVLAAKQHMIGMLQSIEKALTPFRRQDPEQRCWSSPQDRQQCADLAAACEQLLADILAQEKQCEVQMTQRRNEISTQLQDAHTANRARGAYVAQSSPSPGMLDVSSDS